MPKDLFNKKSIRHGIIQFRPGERIRERREEKKEEILEKAGDLVEQTIGSSIENTRLEAPVLSPDAASVPAAIQEPGVWFCLPIPEGMSGDGSEYHIYVRRGTTDNLCIFLSGGGVAWNAYTAARPVTGGKVASGQPNYYWNNLRPFTQIMNIHVGITSNSEKNPFHDWNFIVITYSTGDFHVGEGDFSYTDEDGTSAVLHFRGHQNFRASMDRAVRLFPGCGRLLIAGNSAGAFAVPALAGEIVEDYYPGVRDVTLLSDSGQLLYSEWRHTARDLWKAAPALWKALHTENITLDWYEALTAKYGDRFRYLYASSTHDYLLSAYYSDITEKIYRTDAQVQEIFYEQLKEMIRSLVEMAPGITFYINSWKNVLYTHGGTIHTVVREPYFFLHERNAPSMAQWLVNAVNGHTEDIGMQLLGRIPGQQGRMK